MMIEANYLFSGLLFVAVLTFAGVTHASEKPGKHDDPTDTSMKTAPVSTGAPGAKNPLRQRELKETDQTDFSDSIDLNDRLQPWRLVRHLQRIQDAIAAGKPGSLIAYRKYLAQYSRLMLEWEPKIWTNLRNIDAAAIYVLIGGNPSVGIRAIETSKIADEKKLLLEAAIAYAQRNFVEAHALMLKIDGKTLSAPVAAQFFLAKSMVTSSTDLKSAAKFLNEARRLAPGTLIEEAALRRLLRIAGRNRNQAQFDFITSTYFHRFGNSLYIGDFMRNFAFGLVRMPAENQQKNLIDLQRVIEKLNKNQQIAVASYAARSAVVSGRMSIAGWASNWVLERAKPGGKLHTRMMLYSAASGIVQLDRLEKSEQLLIEINQAMLGANDQKLLNAVKSLAGRISGDPRDLAQLKMDMGIQQQAYPGDDPVVPTSLQNPEEILRDNKTIMRARLLLSRLEEILPEGSP